MSFVRRRLDVEISLGEGDFGEAGQNTLRLRGARVSVQIVRAGDPGLDNAVIRLWGLTESQMNQISSLGKPTLYERRNTVTIFAGDDAGVAAIFFGTIQDAYQNFDSAPDTPLEMTAFVGLLDAMRPVPPSSFTGATDAAVIASSLAGLMVPALALENNGVSVTLASPYFAGTARDQLNKLSQAANFYWTITEAGTTLAIWPKGAARGALIPKLSPSSGMRGYPRYTSSGILVDAIYAPGYAIGCYFELETSIIPAQGRWNITNIVLDLESETPNGAWFMTISATRLDA